MSRFPIQFQRYRTCDVWKYFRDYFISLAQAVSRWFPTATARVRVWTGCGVCGGQSGIGAGFLRVLDFPLPIIPPISPPP
jgi:hypothetical protein